MVSDARWLALPVGALVLAIAGWMLIESRIDVVSDERNVYIHQLPADRDAVVRYRIGDEPYAVAPWDEKGYYVTVPLETDRRPLRGVVPIDLEYRTWVGGLPRTKRISFDVDEAQIRSLRASLGSGGAAYLFQLEGERLHIRAENERCVRWTYSVGDDTTEHEVPEHAEYIDVGQADTVKVTSNLCHRLRRCSIIAKRDGSMPRVDYRCF